MRPEQTSLDYGVVPAGSSDTDQVPDQADYGPIKNYHDGGNFLPGAARYGSGA
jgi:hypothetical protein